MPAPANVVLIVLDTTRADHLGCYGYGRVTSPHLDRIAAQGTLFRQCYSPHIPTHPGFTTMLTGKDVFAHQIVTQGGKVDLDPAVRSLAELLAAQGYVTAAADNLGRWFNRGFQVYERYRWEREGTEWRKAEAVNAVVLPLLDRLAAAGKPFFLFAHYWDPHTPYLPPAPFSRMFYAGDEKDPRHLDGPRSMQPVFDFEPFTLYFQQWMGGVTDRAFPNAQYDAEIAYLDTALAHVFTRLDALGLSEDTLVVITADHGEVLDEHPCWYDHHGLYEENIRVPLLLHQPGRVPAGRQVDGFVTLLDIAPTVLDHLGLGGLAEAEGMQGRSLLPLLGEEAPPGRGTVLEFYLTENTWMRKRGWVTPEWKLIQALEPDCHGFPEIELYDRRADPCEQRNLADELPEVVRELRARLEDYVARRLAATGLPDPSMTQAITLRRIGELKTAVPEDQKLPAQ